MHVKDELMNYFAGDILPTASSCSMVKAWKQVHNLSNN
jgi:hypothetical protein